MRILLAMLFGAFWLFGGAITVGTSALAETWTSNPNFRDTKTAEIVSAAVTTNSDGYQISIFRNKDARVRIVLALPESAFDQLAKKGRIAALRPDQKPIKLIETTPALAHLEQPHVTANSVRDILWHGQDKAPTSGTLRNILDSSRLSVRYFTDTGTTIDVVFSLSGAAPVIAKVLNIPETVPKEQTDQAIAARKIITASVQRCPHTSDMSACMTASTRCMPKEEREFEEASFLACLKKNGWPLD